MTKTKVNVSSGKSYFVYSNNDFDALPQVIKADLEYNYEKVFIITDENVSKLYLDNLIRALKPQINIVGFFEMKAGEEEKNFNTIEKMYEALLNYNMSRKDIVIAFGGGVVGDLVGFCAATYMRGIRFIQIPTTLLSQVDSSVGGKTGYDFMGKKNLIGAFYQPELVYTNVVTLNTLSDEQLSSGLGEVAKYGVIYDSDFFKYLSDNKLSIRQKEVNTLTYIINTSCNIKAKVVAEDEKETSGLREILNFGHTIGHAIEAELMFKLPHGICVAYGMVCASNIAQQKGMIDKKTYKEIITLLQALELIKTQALDINFENVLNLMTFDKKNHGSVIRFVLPTALGKVEICDNVTREEIIKSLNIIKEAAYE